MCSQKHLKQKIEAKHTAFNQIYFKIASIPNSFSNLQNFLAVHWHSRWGCFVDSFFMTILNTQPYRQNNNLDKITVQFNTVFTITWYLIWFPNVSLYLSSGALINFVYYIFTLNCTLRLHADLVRAGVAISVWTPMAIGTPPQLMLPSSSAIAIEYE